MNPSALKCKFKATKTWLYSSLYFIQTNIDEYFKNYKKYPSLVYNQNNMQLSAFIGCLRK